MTTTYFPGTVDHPTQEDADRASKRVTKLPTRETVAESSVVRLKSGGPNMVVMVRRADMVLCQWHVENGDLTTAWLQLSCLEMPK